MAVTNDNSAGTLYGIGVGPGNPELLTLKAARILKEVDWIFAPANAGGGRGLAESIIGPLGIDEARMRRVRLCMKRDRSADADTYGQVAKEIVGALRQGQAVAWITEGDPLFYSTFIHVQNAVRRLDANAPMEIVPGITSITAAAARAGIPVAQLDERVAVIPAAYGLGRLKDFIESFTTVFLLKVNGVLDELLAELAGLPMEVDAWCVERVGSAEERIVRDLASLRGEDLSYFSLIILRRRDARLSP